MSYSQDKRQYNLSAHGLPKEYTACPGCGLQYGHHKTSVCSTCEECSKCCTCGKSKKLVNADKWIQLILEEGVF